MTTRPTPDLAAIHERLWRLEDFARRLSGLLAAAGSVLDAAKFIERENLSGKEAPK